MTLNEKLGFGMIGALVLGILIPICLRAPVLFLVFGGIIPWLGIAAWFLTRPEERRKR